MKDSEQKKAKNLYNCHQCGNTIVTEYIDEGVTPSSLPCSMFGGCSDGRKIAVPKVKGNSGRTSLHEKFNPKKNKK